MYVPICQVLKSIHTPSWQTASSSGVGPRINWRSPLGWQAYHIWYALEPGSRAYSLPWCTSCNCSTASLCLWNVHIYKVVTGRVAAIFRSMCKLRKSSGSNDESRRKKLSNETFLSKFKWFSAKVLQIEDSRFRRFYRGNGCLVFHSSVWTIFGSNLQGRKSF